MQFSWFPVDILSVSTLNSSMWQSGRPQALILHRCPRFICSGQRWCPSFPQVSPTSSCQTVCVWLLWPCRPWHFIWRGPSKARTVDPSSADFGSQSEEPRETSLPSHATMNKGGTLLSPTEVCQSCYPLLCPILPCWLNVLCKSATSKNLGHKYRLHPLSPTQVIVSPVPPSHGGRAVQDTFIL